MDSVLQMVGLLILVLCSAFFSISEISLAAAKNVRLQGLSEAGDQRAREVIALKANPGPMFTIVEIGVNALALAGGILGQDVFIPLSNRHSFTCSANPPLTPQPSGSRISPLPSSSFSSLT